MKGKRKIEITKNGSYLVSGSVPLYEEKIIIDADGFPFKWQITKKYPLKKQYSLCRCGRSKNKPFCDKSHVRTGFSCQETAGNIYFDEQAEVITGPKLILKDLLLLCVHARFCDRAGGIWDLTKKSNDKRAKKAAIEEVGNCPSGRLVVNDKTGKAIEPELDQSISVTYDAEGVAGPLWVKGGIPIESVEGKIYDARNRVTLCQCGLSKNKPFCDGTHLQSIQQKTLKGKND